MTLTQNWRAVLRRAWSIRLLIIAAVLSGLEVVLPLMSFDIEPYWLMPLLIFLATAAAFVARLLAQSTLSGVHTNAD